MENSDIYKQQIVHAFIKKALIFPPIPFKSFIMQILCQFLLSNVNMHFIEFK